MTRLADEGDDPYLWLEDLDGADAARWVRDRNAETVAALTGSEAFAGLRAEIRQVLDAEDRIPWPGWRGDGFYYNFWQDATHPRGVWRRTTLDQYRRREPEWDVLLDVDALAAEEGENWVWNDVTVLRHGYERCLIWLSRAAATPPWCASSTWCAVPSSRTVSRCPRRRAPPAGSTPTTSTSPPTSGPAR
ncbi:hypothetical protein [Micromonospora chersina]|uniref:hypothetical protein n=1 Tax=Micromonospora chersina TaxID=47854 RepID=UPI003D8FA4C7